MWLKFLTSYLQITDYQACTYIQLFVFYLLLLLNYCILWRISQNYCFVNCADWGGIYGSRRSPARGTSPQKTCKVTKKLRNTQENKQKYVVKHKNQHDIPLKICARYARKGNIGGHFLGKSIGVRGWVFEDCRRCTSRVRYSRGTRGVFADYTYVSGMCRVCIGYVSGKCRRGRGAWGHTRCKV